MATATQSLALWSGNWTLTYNTDTDSVHALSLSNPSGAAVTITLSRGNEVIATADIPPGDKVDLDISLTGALRRDFAVKGGQCTSSEWRGVPNAPATTSVGRRTAALGAPRAGSRRPSGVPMIPPLDGRGLLPTGGHSTTVNELYERFVKAFPESTTRPRCWEGWTRLNSELLALVPIIRLWIGGSFVADKANPADLDVTFFLDGVRLDESPLTIQQAVETLVAGNECRGDWSCHSHGVRVYPLGHVSYPRYMEWMDYWQSHWGRTTSGDPRGYVEVVGVRFGLA